jgi:NAD(P)-dependent dehydrogenase (short-subunit alcohol dehydrogenase family)
MSDFAGKVVLVTGASSGIGLATAQLFAERGFRVFGTVRKLGHFSLPHSTVMELDVREDQSVQCCIDAVMEKAGRIDILVNNAGFAVVGAIEESSIQQAHDIFETNFFGVVRMTNAVLPIMRSQQQGRIINISSVSGFLPTPYMGFYAASKHALEGYTESLDHEIRTLGIRAILIEPVLIRTHIGQNTQRSDRPIVIYQSRSQQMFDRVGQEILAGAEPMIVAQKIFEVVNRTTPRLRYTVGRQAALLTVLRKFLPELIFSRSLRDQFQLDADI